MRGHIRRRGKESWAVVFDLGRDATGRRRQKWHSVKGSKKVAQRELARLLNDYNIGEYVEPAKIRVGEYLERWLRDYAKPRVSTKTFERYSDIVSRNIAPVLGDHSLAKLRPLHIQAFYADALMSGRKDGKGGLSAQTVLHFHRLLHKALDQAVKWQMLARNPAAAVEPPRPERRHMRALVENEIVTLLRLVGGTKLFIPVLAAVTGGFRRGELLALRWQDVDLDTGRAVVCRSLEQTREGLRVKLPKTGRSRRTVILPKFTCDALRTHLTEQKKQRLALGVAYNDNDLICAREDGLPWPPDVLSTSFAALIRNSDMTHFRFHDLRHTHATQLLKQGVHPKIVSERLGHSNIGITMDTYSHVLPGMQEDAIAGFDASLRMLLDKAGN